MQTSMTSRRLTAGPSGSQAAHGGHRLLPGRRRHAARPICLQKCSFIASLLRECDECLQMCRFLRRNRMNRRLQVFEAGRRYPMRMPALLHLLSPPELPTARGVKKTPLRSAWRIGGAFAPYRNVSSGMAMKFVISPSLALYSNSSSVNVPLAGSSAAEMSSFNAKADQAGAPSCSVWKSSIR